MADEELNLNNPIPPTEKGIVVKKQRKFGKSKNSVENTPENRAKYEYIIKTKKVEKDTKHRRWIKILLIFLLVLALLGAGIWGITAFLKFNNFQVIVDRPGKDIFALSGHMNLSNKTQEFNIDGPQYMDNITIKGQESTFLKVENGEGSLSKDNLIAATFFLTNVTDSDKTFAEIIKFSDPQKNIEQAIRVMVIKNILDENDKSIKRTVRVYADPQRDSESGGKIIYDKDGKPIPEPVVPLERGTYIGKEIRDITGNEEITDEWTTIPFADSSKGIIMEGRGLNGDAADYLLKPKAKIKYSFFIWLEGNDSQCINPILGGKIKLAFHFTEG